MRMTGPLFNLANESATMALWLDAVIAHTIYLLEYNDDEFLMEIQSYWLTTCEVVSDRRTIVLGVLQSNGQRSYGLRGLNHLAH